MEDKLKYFVNKDNERIKDEIIDIKASKYSSTIFNSVSFV